MFEKYPKLAEFFQSKVKWLYQRYSIPRWMVFTMDNLLVFVTFIVAYLLRFNFELLDFSGGMAMKHAFITVAVYALFNLVFRSYTGLLRHTTIMDIFNVFMTTSVSFIVLIAASFAGRFLGFPEELIVPLSIVIIHYVSITVSLFGIRILVKITYYLITTSYGKKKSVLIYGAGAQGMIVKRVIFSDITNNYHIVGFLDSNKSLQGKKINGIRIYDPAELNYEFIEKNQVESLIFAIRDIGPCEKSGIIRSALNLGLEVLEMPSIDTWLNGKLQIRQIQKVKLKDLLGRDPILLNMKRIGIGLSGRTILITGAAGSIGSEIVRQLTRFNVKQLILVDQAETPVFHLENELRHKFKSLKIQVKLADVTNFRKMEAIFEMYRPEIVFHAAAYKHVPLMEDNPHEAFRVNVGGTMVVSDLSVRYGVKKFVMISTDKAVNPTNVMGTSKRICEMIVQNKSRQPNVRTQFVTTRFGNVLGSNGSVIPLFSRQIEEGGPITVTHPEITRYFMTIPEACELVLEAGFMGKGGEIFVFDMGHPVKIVDLARQMIQLSGLVPDQDIKIEFTGLRPGEKLYEELLSDSENTLPTHHPRIKVAKLDHIHDPLLWRNLETILEKLYTYGNRDIVRICMNLVPEFETTNPEYATLKKKVDRLKSAKQSHL
jgi:FlaA1/EpsC-like NDP-sugar epimerase